MDTYAHDIIARGKDRQFKEENPCLTPYYVTASSWANCRIKLIDRNSIYVDHAVGLVSKYGDPRICSNGSEAQSKTAEN
jgi:hypothetical protein